VCTISRCKINSAIEGKQWDFITYASCGNFLNGYENINTFWTANNDIVRVYPKRVAGSGFENHSNTQPRLNVSCVFKFCCNSQVLSILDIHSGIFWAIADLTSNHQMRCHSHWQFKKSPILPHHSKSAVDDAWRINRRGRINRATLLRESQGQNPDHAHGLLKSHIRPRRLIFVTWKWGLVDFFHDRSVFPCFCSNEMFPNPIIFYCCSSEILAH
jgi:hypothetical protein